MNSLRLVLSLCVLSLGAAVAQAAQDTYPVDPDSVRQPGVPAGQVFQFDFNRSRIYPGTHRVCWVYIPAQYDPAKPACLYVCLDSGAWEAPTVFDNLIHQKQMPVTIGVFVAPGTVTASDGTVLRFDRSFEFDSMNDRFARFLLEELLPAVERRRTPDGRPIRISSDPNDRAIAGGSSGAICAFTVAWQRPDAFSRVFSSIGTYVAMRGGDAYPALVRKTEPKPLRIFLQDGSKDTWNPLFGNWWEQNQSMESALRFAGYEVEHVWGTGGHNGRHATAIFPQAMRWLWQGWPKRVQSGLSGNGTLQEILLPGTSWRQVEGKAMASGENAPAAKTATAGLDARGLLTLSDGSAYVAETDKIWHVAPNGKKTVVDEGLHTTGAMALSPDHRLLFVAEARSPWIYSFCTQPDGTLRFKQRFYWLHIIDASEEPGASALAVDEHGNLYAATQLGIQVCDRNGRVRAILPSPAGRITSLYFGGEARDELFITCGGKCYVRKMKVPGAPAWAAPVKLPRGSPG